MGDFLDDYLDGLSSGMQRFDPLPTGPYHGTKQKRQWHLLADSEREQAIFEARMREEEESASAADAAAGADAGGSHISLTRQRSRTAGAIQNIINIPEPTPETEELFGEFLAPDGSVTLIDGFTTDTTDTTIIPVQDLTTIESNVDISTIEITSQFILENTEPKEYTNTTTGEIALVPTVITPDYITSQQQDTGPDSNPHSTIDGYFDITTGASVPMIAVGSDTLLGLMDVSPAYAELFMMNDPYNPVDISNVNLVIKDVYIQGDGLDVIDQHMPNPAHGDLFLTYDPYVYRYTETEEWEVYYDSVNIDDVGYNITRLDQHNEYMLDHTGTGTYPPPQYNELILYHDTSTGRVAIYQELSDQQWNKVFERDENGNAAVAGWLIYYPPSSWSNWYAISNVGQFYPEKRYFKQVSYIFGLTGEFNMYSGYISNPFEPNMLEFFIPSGSTLQQITQFLDTAKSTQFGDPYLGYIDYFVIQAV